MNLAVEHNRSQLSSGAKAVYGRSDSEGYVFEQGYDQIRISGREVEVLTLIAHEYTTAEIAQRMYISMHTVNSHRKNIMAKLDVRNVAGMIRKSFELGILSATSSISRKPDMAISA